MPQNAPARLPRLGHLNGRDVVKSFRALFLLASLISTGACQNSRSSSEEAKDHGDFSSEPHTTTSDAAPASEQEPGLFTSLTMSAQNISEDIAKAVDQRTKKLKGVATDEVEKLFTVEYKIEQIERGVIVPSLTQNSAASGAPEASVEEQIRLESRLAELGKERWQCFHVEEQPKYIRLYCQRPSPTYLRLLARGGATVF